MTPPVTVVVTTYNQASYIGAALASVLAQTCRPHEIIVVDDGSTDDTPDRLAAFTDRVLYVRQSNQGVAAARNAGVVRATGELVALLDGDDLWEPQKLACQVSAAVQHPESGLIATDGVHFEGDNSIIRSSLIGEPIAALLDPVEPLTLTCYRELLRKNFISTTSQVLVPCRVLQTVGPSDTRFPVSSDWDLYLRIAAKFPLTILPQKLTRYRYLDSSASGPRHVRTLRWRLDDIAVLKKHLASAPPDLRDLIRDSLYRKILDGAETAYYHGRDHDRGFARRYLLRLLRDNPTSLPTALCLVGLYVPQPVAGAAKRLLGWPTV